MALLDGCFVFCLKNCPKKRVAFCLFGLQERKNVWKMMTNTRINKTQLRWRTTTNEFHTAHNKIFALKFATVWIVWMMMALQWQILHWRFSLQSSFPFAEHLQMGILATITFFMRRARERGIKSILKTKSCPTPLRADVCFNIFNIWHGLFCI